MILFAETHPWGDHVGIAAAALASGWWAKAKTVKWGTALRLAADALPPLPANASFKEQWSYRILSAFKTKTGG